MVKRDFIEEAVDRLLKAAPRGSKVILFGSYAREDVNEESDLDFLVVEPEVKNRFAEMTRLREELDTVIAPYLVPADVLVMSAERFEYWKDTPNTVSFEAFREGRIYEEIA
jgi:uncharacterized protein